MTKIQVRGCVHAPRERAANPGCNHLGSRSPPPVDQLLSRARKAGIIDVNTSALGGTADGSSDGDEMCTAMDADLDQLARIVKRTVWQVDQCVLNPLMAIEAKATHVSAHQEMKALAIGPAPEVF